MKKTILNFLLLTLPFLVFSQEENFIKIVGNSSMDIEASNARVTVQLTEIKRDEYNKIRERSIEEIMDELKMNLKGLGYSLSDLEEIWPPTKNYQKTKSQKYYLSIKDIEDAKKIFKFEIKGFEASKFEYIYDTPVKLDEYKLSEAAIKDAFKKAEALAGYAGKKVGKVINIEDKSQSHLKISEQSNNKKTTLNYNIIITYELLD